MTKKKNLYTEDSIITETPRQFTQRSPSTYLGSARKNRALISEIYANCIDEYAAENCNKITIIIDTNKNEYSVEDNGQGFLINSGIDSDGKTILQRSFDTINTSGKTTEDGVYQGTSLGLNGIGAKLANWLSLELNVITYRDGEFEELWFEDGLFKNREVGKADRPSGTIVKWKPNPKFFKENDPDISVLKPYLEEISALCPNLETTLIYNGETTIYHTPEGLNSLMDKRVAGKELFTNRFNIERELGKDKINICLTYTTNYSDDVSAYVNLGHTDSGAHISAMKSSFVRAINKYATENNLLKKNEKNLDSNEVKEGLTIIFNVTTTSAKYDAQNKSRIDDIDASIINATMSGDFGTWLNQNPSEASIIIERALNARRARDAAKKAKEKIRKVSKKEKSLFADLPSKLSDAYPHNKNDRSKCELYLSEGDSAASSINSTKDSSFQATFPLRGKVLCCQTAPLDKIYANAEIGNIVKALGLDVEKDTGKLKYDKKKLRYDKIILACDNDTDGFSIQTLLITALNWLCQDLILNGHVYTAESALFKAIFKDGTYKLFADDAEFDNWKAKNPDAKYKLERNKGLGSLTTEDTYEQLVNPKTRNIRQVIFKDVEELERYLELFEGNEVEPRRQFLAEHFNDYREV